VNGIYIILQNNLFKCYENTVVSMAKPLFPHLLRTPAVSPEMDWSLVSRPDGSHMMGGLSCYTYT